ncbi:MAG: hypothetical protein H6738_15985 [Alphaproteobacteria bacterium]|nr:hypothetical protein [Alphaproteobacteria bacterium]MCB9698279.1 hypothetical protein [Alphaproteobacteria bacterium]
MADAGTVWGDVIGRMGLAPVMPIEDGLRYAVDTTSARVEADIHVYRDPVTVRIVIRPQRVEGSFLLAPAHVVPTPIRWKTGDVRFDERVAILAGGRAVLPRLGAAERERLLEVVGEIGAVVGSDQATLEPAMAARFTDPKDAMATLRDLVRLATRLSADPPFEELLDRWYQDDGAPSVTSAVARRVVEVLPTISEDQAATACRLILERGDDAALTLLSVMPPYACVLTAWFRLGDPLDPRVAVRVVDAWRAGSHRPAARYLVWLLAQPNDQAVHTARKLWDTPGLTDDQNFVREFLRAVKRDPPAQALRLLLQIQPRSSSVARRLARALVCYPNVEVDHRLAEWLDLQSGGVRQAGAQALAERTVNELLHGGRSDRLELVRKASEKSGELVRALVERVPTSHTSFLAPLKPHAEPDAIALIRRLGQGGTDVDDPLLFWLDRGTLPVRMEAARALANAGSPKVLGALRERASSWFFSDSAFREACRTAMEAIRKRAGGAGNLALATTAGGEISPPTENVLPLQKHE